MTVRHAIAVAVAVGTMAAALAQPLWIRVTGEDVVLEIRPVDPLSFFRGNYVDLSYNIDAPVPRGLDPGDTAYVVFDDSRPAKVKRVTEERPDLGPGERCIAGEVTWSETVQFPALEQYFVTAEDGLGLERRLSEMVGVVKTTGSCRAILTNVEPE